MYEDHKMGSFPICHLTCIHIQGYTINNYINVTFLYSLNDIKILI